MNTVLSPTRPVDQDRLDNLTELTRDTRVSRFDRLSLRLGLWLMLRAERRALHRDDRDARARRALARECRVRAERDAAFVRAATAMMYR